MPATRMTMNAAEWAMLIALSLLWGGSFFFNGVAVRELPPLTIVFFRVALAALFLAAVMRLAGQRFPLRRDVLLAFAAMGILNNAIPFSLIVWGQSQIPSGVASILNATMPLFTVLVAHLFTSDEKLTPLRMAGVLAGMVGVAAMSGAGTGAVRDVPLLAYAACLAAALSYACASVFGRRFRTLGVAPIAVATGQLTASSILLLPLMIAVDQPWALPLPGAGVIAAVIALATVSTAMAYILYFRILSGAGATSISLVTLLIPPSAILLGVLFLGEVMEPRHFAGLALIGLGLALVDGRLLRRHTAKAV